MSAAEFLDELECIGVLPHVERGPTFPATNDPAAIYLAAALAGKSRVLIASGDVLRRLQALNWLRSIVLSSDGEIGVAWLDYGRAKRAGALSGGVLEPAGLERSADRFIEEVLARAVGPARSPSKK